MKNRKLPSVVVEYTLRLGFRKLYKKPHFSKTGFCLKNMAANSLLYLLLATGLAIGLTDAYTRRPYGLAEDSAALRKWTIWPSNEEKPLDAEIIWPAPGSNAETPEDQITALSESETQGKCPKREHFTKCHKHCEKTCDNYMKPIPCPKSCRKGCVCDGGLVRNKQGKCVPRDQCAKKAEIIWPRATEEPVNQDDWPHATDKPVNQDENWPPATEKPVNQDEEEQPQLALKKKGKRKCPKREHFTKCHKNCEKTCDNYMKPIPCPKSCKKGCVCDGGLVRNKKGKCVPRDQCLKKQMAGDDDSHGCPYEYTCDVYCVTKVEKRGGCCEGNICKCYDR